MFLISRRLILVVLAVSFPVSFFTSHTWAETESLSSSFSISSKEVEPPLNDNRVAPRVKPAADLSPSDQEIETPEDIEDVSAPSLPGQEALNLFMDGVDAFDEADYEEAVDSFLKAIELEPSRLDFRYFLGVTYALTKRDMEALEVFEAIVNEDPAGYVRAYFDISAIYSRQKMYEKAVEALCVAETIDPENGLIYLYQGYARKSLKDYEGALNSFNKAKDVDSKLTQRACYNIGTIYLETERFDRAEEMFNRAIEIDPATPAAKNGRQALANVRVGKRMRKPWYLSMSLTWAYDDNVPLDPLDAVSEATGGVTNDGDQFQTFLLRAGYKFINEKDFQVGAGYSIYSIGYDDWVENNLVAHTPHLFIKYNGKPFYFRLQYDYGYYYSGGDPIDGDRGLYLNFGDDSDSKLRMHSVTPTITILEPHDLRSDIILNYQKKDYLDGITSDSSFYSAGIVQYFKSPWGEGSPRAGYRYGYEDAREETSSYRVHEGHVGFSSPVLCCFMADVSFTYMRVNHQNFPGKGDRRDRSYMTSVSLSRLFFERLQLRCFYHYNHSNSNVFSNGSDPYKFKKNVFSISSTYVF